MQNSHRVLLAKPRTAVASRHGRRRGGASGEPPRAMGTSRPTATGHEWGARGGGEGAGVFLKVVDKGDSVLYKWSSDYS